MPSIRLTRRAALLLPVAMAACGHQERTDFAPLRYNFLPPIRLKVATLSVEQRYFSSGVAPDVTALDPVHPVEALRAMAEDRLQAVGMSGHAVFAITNASLTRQDDIITCALAAVLEIYSAPGVRSGFAQAIVSRQHTGSVDDLRGTLYDMTKMTMDAMNVEFEYQVTRNLQPWLVPASSVPPPVQQQPLATPAGSMPPPMAAPPGLAPMLAPSAPPPQPLAPPASLR